MIWLKDFGVVLKSAKRAHKASLPPNWEGQGRDMLLRVVHLVSCAQHRTLNEEFVVTIDKTGIAYNKLAVRGVEYRGEKSSNVALADKRTCTLPAGLLAH